jgi:hypothetical protein
VVDFGRCDLSRSGYRHEIGDRRRCCAHTVSSGRQSA